MRNCETFYFRTHSEFVRKTNDFGDERSHTSTLCTKNQRFWGRTIPCVDSSYEKSTVLGTNAYVRLQFVRKTNDFGDERFRASTVRTKNRRFWGRTQPCVDSSYEKPTILGTNVSVRRQFVRKIGDFGDKRITLREGL